jgi:hypothetical protein
LRHLSLLIALSLACSSPPVVDRDDGDRTPLGAECDPIDTDLCLLPWPSNTFTTLDPSTETGLRLAVDPSSMNPSDDGSSLAAADGFSRVTSLVTVFDAPLDPETLAGSFHLFLAQHDHPERGHEVPLRVEVVTDADGRTLLSADPLEVLEAAADYVVVVTDALRYADGGAPSASPSVRVALALDRPATVEDAALAGYHAPARRLLEELEIDPEGVLRVWDFTTRSADNPRRAMVHVRAEAIAAVDTATVVFDSVEVENDDPNIAMIVHGHLSGMPTFLTAERFAFVLDGEGNPIAQGTTDVPFRVLIPAGTEDYRFVMYGHGTGGNEYDRAFDGDLAGLGVAKVNIRFYGWTGEDVILTFARLKNMVLGSAGAAAPLVEALAHAAAIQHAMSGVLADALSAAMIDGEPNPAAGRRPNAENVIWVGGSLGGTSGVVYASADPAMRYAVVNVPGAAWSHWVRDSYTFQFVRALVPERIYTDVDLAVGLAMGQTNLDLADGAAWTDVLANKPTAFLVQESMGDPVMPNAATEMVARTVGARHVGGVLEPIAGIQTAPEVIEASGITQFRTPDTSELDVHGFAARGTQAGVAAREQILHFLETAWAGESVIVPPSICPASGCDFSE